MLRTKPDTVTATHSPAMLKAFEDIRQYGIREARQHHFERKRLVDQFKANQVTLWGYLNLFRPQPLLSMDEAIRHYKAIVTFQRKLAADPVLRFSARRDLGLHRMAAERVLVARYFRRFGQRVWKRDTRRAA